MTKRTKRTRTAVRSLQAAADTIQPLKLSPNESAPIAALHGFATALVLMLIEKQLLTRSDAGAMLTRASKFTSERSEVLRCETQGSVAAQMFVDLAKVVIGAPAGGGSSGPGIA